MWIKSMLKEKQLNKKDKKKTQFDNEKFAIFDKI